MLFLIELKGHMIISLSRDGVDGRIQRMDLGRIQGMDLERIQKMDQLDGFKGWILDGFKGWISDGFKGLIHGMDARDGLKG